MLTEDFRGWAQKLLMQNADAGSEDDGDAMKGLKEENYQGNEEEVWTEIITHEIVIANFNFSI